MFPFDLMQPIDAVDQTFWVLHYVLVVPREHLLELPELYLMYGLDKVTLILGVVEERT
jgi:hypothetical protein